MRASKLITISTVAVLMGSVSLAIGQELATGQEDAGSLQGGTISEGSARNSETGGSNQRAAKNPMRRSETNGQRGSNVKGSRDLQRGQPMAAERGRAIARERSLAMTAERRQATAGQGTKAAGQIQSQPGSQSRQSFGKAEIGKAYARASTRDTNASLNAEQRARLREIVAARQDIPRLSNLSGVRLNAVIPRNVRLAAIPEEVVRIYPRFRRHQAFIYRNEMVVVDPLTSRIVAVLPA
jgi:pyruvate/2-oxoglutarate dehydrogenase complex dihydrolipoamide acyltransferase (E2) component